MFHSVTAPAQYLPQFIPEFPARRQMLPPSLKKLYWSESGAQRNSATIQTAATPLHHATCMWIWRTQILWVSQPFASILATPGSTVGPEAASGSLPEMQSLHFMFGKIDSFYSSSLLEWKFGLKLFSWKKPSDLPVGFFLGVQVQSGCRVIGESGVSVDTQINETPTCHRPVAISIWLCCFLSEHFWWL